MTSKICGPKTPHSGGIERRLQADEKQERDRRQDRRDGKGQCQNADQQSAIARGSGVTRGNAADEIGGADTGHQGQPVRCAAFAFATSFIIRTGVISSRAILGGRVGVWRGRR
jgi:hypothetical protein